MVALRLTVVFILSSLVYIVGHKRPWPATLPQELSALDISVRIRVDPEATFPVSTDFGRLVSATPAAVLFPSSNLDIMALLSFANESPRPFKVAPRGRGHSLRGRRSLARRTGGGHDTMATTLSRITVSSCQDGSDPQGSAYVDAGGEQLWADVLRETLKHGLAPKSWTDYLYLTVGGTLSNAGISGQAFRHGPQISTVYELDVITGKGEMKTCSKEHNSDLFYAVLGGLGQFGVITRARIALEPAPDNVKWVRLIYTDFAAFTKDQEYLISLDGRPTPGTNSTKSKGFDYVEGSVFLDRSPVSSWRSSFKPADSARINSLITKYGPVYCLEAGIYYRNASKFAAKKDLDRLLEELSFIPGMTFIIDIGYVRFLNRVCEGELQLRAQGLWDVPHPWLALFVPRSRISDFNARVFRRIIRENRSKGPILVYPVNRDSDPDEGVFYSVSLLWSATTETLEQLEAQNEEVLRFCNDEGIKVKQYLPHYEERSDWVKHFGAKWEVFLERKRKYDPKRILSPGQGIFTSSAT
ncbi:unnamed protein product [Spirodela intermedia]|uniref:cytokinin dehydrogenase n=1 Tax=Spirodela intermedia TaxID=51605 RepID=A0A7I8JNC2_SPIIN|nr:unnamed protein product [Spirodela intermedia]CAA6671677.1 unnamed protein product [Spirodela intermedia]